MTAAQPLETCPSEHAQAAQEALLPFAAPRRMGSAEVRVHLGEIVQGLFYSLYSVEHARAGLRRLGTGRTGDFSSDSTPQPEALS